MKQGMVLILGAFLMMGCATTSNQEHGTEMPADAANKGAEGGSVLADPAPVAKTIDPACKLEIRQMVTKQEGGQQYLLADGSIWQAMPDQSIRFVKKMTDSVENYQLIPSTDVMIHYTNNKIMLIHVETGTEFFNLVGDPTPGVRRVMFTPDNLEMGILDKNRVINIWNVPKRFSGISISERVQDFINRQSPDHKLRFSTDSYMVSLAGSGRAVLASDNVADNKIGLIYYMDESKNKGILKALARTNVPINHLAISLSANYVAATDVNGQLYVTSTGEDRGFKVYARRFNAAKNVKFVDDNVLVLGDGTLTLVDVETGLELWTSALQVKSCYAPSSAKVVCTTGDTVLEIDAKTGSLERTLFFNGTTWGAVVGETLSGTADASCLK